MVITLESARINAGYSQKEAGDLFGVHYQTIAKWEEDNTKMPFDMVNKIPEVYGIEHNHIFFGVKNEFIRYVNKFRKFNYEFYRFYFLFILILTILFVTI